MNNKRLRGSRETNISNISQNSSAYFSPKSSSSQEKMSTPNTPIPNDTNEGRRQRRFDSLSRILGLNSKKSACAAVTIVDDELIIAANCADGEDPSSIAQLLKQKLIVLRTILKRIKNQADFSLEQSDADNFFAIDINALKVHGGFFQTIPIVVQALYKLCRSVSGTDNLDIDEMAFTHDEINILLESTNITVLVPGEKELDSYDETDELDLSDITTMSPPLSSHSSMTSMKSNTTLSSYKSVSTFPMFSPSRKVSFANSNPELSTVMHSSSTLLEDDNHEDDVFDSFCRMSPIRAGYASSGQPAKKDSFAQFWDKLNEESDSSADETAIAPMSKAEYIQPTHDYILSSLDESFTTTANDSFSSNRENYELRYVMNVYKQGNNDIISFPESIYQKTNKPRSVTGFHAEQLIAFYLKNVKGINLHDTSLPPISIGISKLCCRACCILYNYERLKIRGSSFNNINGVPNILSEDPDTFYSTLDYQTPKKAAKGEISRVAQMSPWT